MGKKKKKNQDILSLILFFAITVMIFIGLAWLDRGYRMPTNYKSGIESQKKEQKDYDGILIVATVTTITIILAVAGKKISDKKKQAKRKRELQAKLDEIRKNKNSNDDIARIIAAGRSTINSRNYHKNYYKDRDDKQVVDVRRHRMTIEELSRLEEEEYGIEDIEIEKPKNKLFLIGLACIICLAVGFMVAILLF